MEKKSGISFSNLKNKFPEIKKKAFGTEGIIIGITIVVLLFLTVIIVQSCTPRRGGIIYGMCREFLQLQLPFPDTIKHTEIEIYRKAVRIYFTHTDGFGEYQLEMTECSFMQDPQQGVQLESVFFDYVKDVTQKERAPGRGKLYAVEQKHIDLFNKSRSPEAMLSGNPDFIIPDDALLYYY